MIGKLLDPLRRAFGRSEAMRHAAAAIERLLEQGMAPIRALETGTIRSYHEKHESTRLIGEALGSQGTLVSVDVSEESIRISKDICRALSNIEWVASDSHAYLRTLAPKSLHFVLLDSMNDKAFIMGELQLAVPAVVDGGLIMIDDAGVRGDGSGIDPGTRAEKGHEIFAFLREHAYPFRVLTTNHSTQIELTVEPRLRELLAQG